MSIYDDSGPAFPVSADIAGMEGLKGSALGMSLRQYAAIHLRVPDSGVGWLDEMIRKAQRDELAAKVMQGLLANPCGPIQANGMSGWNWCNCTLEDVADLAWHIADAMLRARESAPAADPVREAAPELLEAAKSARDALAVAIKAAWEGFTDADVAEHIAVKKLDAAIARATGQEG